MIKKIVYAVMLLIFLNPAASKAESHVMKLDDEKVPEIICAPLQACDIELEAGEKILGVYLGDTARWIYEVAESGVASTLQQHLIVKPKDALIATSLIITTTNRTYHIKLKSEENNFFIENKFEYQYLSSDRNVQNNIDSELQIDLEHISFNYQINKENFFGKSPEFFPVSVFNDGQHVYIVMDKKALAYDLPALFLENEGELMMVNYRIKGNYYIVDHLFKKAALVYGVGKNQVKVEIINQG